MADLITGDTQLGATKQDLIAAVVQKELKFKASLSPYFTDVSAFCNPGAKSISFPKLSSFTVIDRASGVAGDSSVLTSSVDKLDLDVNAYVAWIIDSSDEIQSTLASQMEFAKRAASAMGRYVDTKLYTALETHGVATATAGASITRDIILEMQEGLLKRNANLSQLVLIIPPEQRTAMLKIASFTEAQVYGGAVIPSGVIGQVYGMPVVVHNGLTSAQYYMAEKEGLAYGFQKVPAMSSQPANEYGTSAMRTAMDQLFGVKGLQLGQEGVGASESALIVKDAN